MVLCVTLIVVVNVAGCVGSQDYRLTLVLAINCIIVSDNKILEVTNEQIVLHWN